MNNCNMSGKEIRKKLVNEGFSITQLSALLGTSQQNLSVKLSKEAVKTDLLESLCDVLNKDLFFFYGGTKYLPAANSVNSEMVPKYLYDELKEEIYNYRDTIKDLQHQIKLMQKGYTIQEIAKKEVV